MAEPTGLKIVQEDEKPRPIAFKAGLLDKYSSFHQLPILTLLGIKTKKFPYLTAVFNFNLHTAIPPNTRSQFTINICDSEGKAPNHSFDFCVKDLTRWRLNVSTFESFSAYLDTLSQSQKKKYHQTQQAYQAYGATLSLIENDWSQHVEAVYQLYYNVAKKHGGVLYDLDFFRVIAKDSHYKLMCVWYKEKMVSALVMIDETPVFHSMVCGLDYEHSQHTRAYSLMHYEIIRLAIDAKKYSIVDIGMTGDRLKAIMGYKAVPVRMEITSRNVLIKGMLRMLSRFYKPKLSI